METEYLCVTVSRSEETILYLKVPKGWRPKGRDYKLMGKAARETTDDWDWDNYGWEEDVEIQGHKVVAAEEAESYKVFDATGELQPVQSVPNETQSQYEKSPLPL